MFGEAKCYFDKCWCCRFIDIGANRLPFTCCIYVEAVLVLKTLDSLPTRDCCNVTGCSHPKLLITIARCYMSDGIYLL